MTLLSYPASGQYQYVRPEHNSNGILGGWATTGTGATGASGIIVGTDWAALDGSGNVVAYSAYNDFTGANLHGAFSGEPNVRITAATAGTVTVDTAGANSTTDVNTIDISDPVARTIVIGSGNTLRFGQFGGILHSSTSNSDYAIGISQNEGTITAGGPTGGSGELVLTSNNAAQTTGQMIINSAIADNSMSGLVTLIKTGPGSVKLRGHNTYSGGTYIQQGRVQLAGNEIGTANYDGFGGGPVYISPGAQFFYSCGGTTDIENNLYISGIGITETNEHELRRDPQPGNWHLFRHHNDARRLRASAAARISARSPATPILTFATDLTPWS